MNVPQVAKSSDMVAYSEGCPCGAGEEYERCRGIHRRGDHHPPHHRLMAAHPATMKYGVSNIEDVHDITEATKCVGTVYDLPVKHRLG